MSSDPTEPEAPLGRVAVLGLGVMGGSLCRALTDTGLAERVTGWSPEATERDAAVTARAVDFAAAEWRAAVQDADLVVLAVPLDAATRMLPEVAAVARGATLTDVASLKGPVADAAVRAGVESRWVGSHPMAGSEQRGFWASRSDLYQDARVWLCRAAHGDPIPPDASAARVTAMWRGVGAEPAWLSAPEHDRLMAVASHLPQLVSNTLALVMEDAGLSPDQLGPGGLDVTRLAASSPEMWRDLLVHADPALVAGLRDLARTAERLATHVDDGDVEAIERLMRRTRAWRRR